MPQKLSNRAQMGPQNQQNVAKNDPETSSEKATRHTVFKDTFQAEFTQNLEGPTSQKHCYLLHGSHVLTFMV